MIFPPTGQGRPELFPGSPSPKPPIPNHLKLAVAVHSGRIREKRGLDWEAVVVFQSIKKADEFKEKFAMSNKVKMKKVGNNPRKQPTLEIEPFEFGNTRSGRAIQMGPPLKGKRGL